MNKTKRDFTKAVSKCKGLNTWFIEDGYSKLDYVIEIWTYDGYTIGDNEATTERIYVIHNEVSRSDGWDLAIKAVQTIKPKN